jgi:hypothetical protein
MLTEDSQTVTIAETFSGIPRDLLHHYVGVTLDIDVFLN